MKKKTYTERKNYREYLELEDDRVLNVKKAGIDLINKDEVFVLVNKARNYWISNCGRLVNNVKTNFRIHKRNSSNTHYTITVYGEYDNEPYNLDTNCDRLVAEAFLENQGKYKQIWHIDRDKANCYYKNLIYVTSKEYSALYRGALTVNELGRKQEYKSYIALKGNPAYQVWSGIYNRCYVNNDKNSCYKEAIMCEQWKNDKDAFSEWYMSNYYECDGEQMAVDKDLLVPGNKEYAPDKCCILPQTLNTMLSNCKKHRIYRYWTKKMELPLGVKYDERLSKYYGLIKPFGHDEAVNLSYWDTPEEAFAEYREFKLADIKMMALKYKDRIPKHVYQALLKVDVKPYVEDN